MPDRPIHFPPGQLQKKYWHSRAFGFPKNYTPANAQKFADVLRNFINNPATEQRAGTWRGDPAVHYLNRETGMNVITHPDGKYWTNFTLGPEQLTKWPNVKQKVQHMKTISHTYIPLDAYTSLIKAFLDRQLSAEELREKYYHTQRRDLGGKPEEISNVLYAFFGYLDDYNPLLRPEDESSADPYDISEQTLRKYAAEALEKLKAVA